MSVSEAIPERKKPRRFIRQGQTGFIFIPWDAADADKFILAQDSCADRRDSIEA
jgi:hypothetical protein